MGQTGTMPTWMCPFTGETFLSKDYTILTVKPGENAWQMFSAKTPRVVEYVYGNGKNEIPFDTKHQQEKAPVNKSACKNDTDVPYGLQHSKVGTHITQDTSLNHSDAVNSQRGRLHDLITAIHQQHELV